MKRLKISAFLLAASLVGAACLSPSQPSNASRSISLAGQVMTPCYVALRLGSVCATLEVAEDPAQPAGRTIGLRVAVIPARGVPAQDAVFFIAGGPGGSTIGTWLQAPSTFPGLTAHHDVVLVDQRGTGDSHPIALPPTRPGETLTDYAKRALSEIDGDPRFYTTAVAMDDLDLVRQALGYKSIDLYGASYGATAVQYFLRQHGDRVRTAVLDGGTLLDVPIMELIAANSQRALDGLLNRCEADDACNGAFPAIREELRAVLQSLDRGPVTTSFQGADGQPLVLTHDAFAAAVHNRLLSATAAAAVPRMIHAAATGDYALVAEGLNRMSDSTESPLLMSAVIRCSEAWAAFDPAQVNLLGAGSYYVTAQVKAATEQAAGCALMPKGVVPADDRQPVRTSVPVLLLNGELDPQDPPANVKGAAQEMTRSLTVTIPGQGHTVGHLDCLPSVVVAFVDTGQLNPASAHACAARVPTPPFQL